MNRQEMIQQVKKQLAIDLNCVVTDFDQPGICFCPALDLPGRRPFPRKNPVFDMGHFWYRYHCQCIRTAVASFEAAARWIGSGFAMVSTIFVQFGTLFSTRSGAAASSSSSRRCSAGVELQGTDKKSVSDTGFFQRAGI